MHYQTLPLVDCFKNYQPWLLVLRSCRWKKCENIKPLWLGFDQAEYNLKYTPKLANHSTINIFIDKIFILTVVSKTIVAIPLFPSYSLHRKYIFYWHFDNFAHLGVKSFLLPPATQENPHFHQIFQTLPIILQGWPSRRFDSSTLSPRSCQIMSPRFNISAGLISSWFDQKMSPWTHCPPRQFLAPNFLQFSRVSCPSWNWKNIWCHIKINPYF